MKLIAHQSGPLQGILTLPGDKSLSHRTALFAALADGESQIENYLSAGVTEAMLNALSALGVPWALEGDTLIVQGQGVRGLKPPLEPINCGNSATTMRLLAGAVAAAGISAVLDGSPGLRHRPMRRIIAPLQKMGVAIEGKADHAPLTLKPSSMPLKATDYTLPVASAQVKSCLLLAALSGNRATVLREPGPSRDHTERLLSSMGVPINRQGWPDEITSATTKSTQDQTAFFLTKLTPPAPLSLSPLKLRLPGDFSSAAFIIIAALLAPGSEIHIKHVGLNPTRTGLLDALTMMGADIEMTGQAERHGEPLGDLHVRASALQGIEVSGSLVVRMIDEFPAFAIAAALAKGQTTVRGAEELRHKETDRIRALCSELRSLGGAVVETHDGFNIAGGSIFTGGGVSSHGDHRLAMALAVAGLNAQKPVVVQDADVITESFPDFVSTLTSMGAALEEST